MQESSPVSLPLLIRISALSDQGLKLMTSLNLMTLLETPSPNAFKLGVKVQPVNLGAQFRP